MFRQRLQIVFVFFYPQNIDILVLVKQNSFANENTYIIY